MPDFKNYIKTDIYNYRIKFAFEPTPEQLGHVIDLINIKYQAYDVLPLVKTIFQAKPLDFANLDAGEIWMLDFSTPRGIHDDVFVAELGKLLACSRAYIRLRNKDDMYQSMLPDENALGLDLDEYIVKVTDPHYKSDSTAVDVDTIAGQVRTDDAVKDAVDKYRSGNGGYYKYLAANFGDKE